MADTELQKRFADLAAHAAEKVFRELKVTADAPEVQAELLARLGTHLYDRVLLEILKKLPDSEHARFEVLMGAGNLDTLLDFLESHIPDFDQWVLQVARDEYHEIKNTL